MNVFVCLKQVPDPDAINTYALWGRLELDESRRAFRTEVTRIMNAYDEQAIEAALRLRDQGVGCSIIALTVGTEDTTSVLRHALAMGCDDAVQVIEAGPGVDALRTAALLAAAINRLGGADIVLCGRQGSDYDQGAVPGVLAELLGTALVTTAAQVVMDDGRLRVRRVTPDGELLLLAGLPCTVSVSNELGIPRYPTAQGRMRARRYSVRTFDAAELVPERSVGAELVELAIPEVRGQCVLIEGDTPAAQAAALITRLRAGGVLNG